MERIKQIQQRIKEDGILISDRYAIAYGIDEMIYPGERFLGLWIPKQGKPILFLNALFEVRQSDQFDVIEYHDTDLIVDVVRPIMHCSCIGVDKTFQAKFLLPLMKAYPDVKFSLGSYAVDDTRAIKQKDEQEKMRKASRINDLAMGRFVQLIHDGVSEKQVADQLLDIYLELGASGYSFEPIVAFGKNAADPHHMPDDTVIQEGDAVLFDVGCIVDGYCSDMTRTFFYKTYPNEKQQQVYHLVQRANEEAEKAVKPGVLLKDIDHVARKIITDDGYGPFFTHRLGHFIGIETHEFGDVSASNENLTAVGNTFSIEPGIYDPDTLGCRIEDLVLVTETGVEVLNQFPKHIQVIS